MKSAIVSLSIILVFTIFLASCKQPTADTPENVCTLTESEVPEIRGFRLGTSLAVIRNRLPEICPVSSNGFVKLALVPVSPTVINKVGNGFCSTDNKWSNINLTEHPEFEGVSRLELQFSDGYLSGMSVQYPDSTSDDLGKEFHKRIQESLGLSLWTNWEHKIEKPPDTDRLRLREIETNSLLCNKVLIRSSVLRFQYQKEIRDINNNIEDLNYTSIIYEPTLVVWRTKDVALSQSQKRLSEEQKAAEKTKADEELRQADKKRAEAFRP
jgi:hypothetical protein